MLAQEQLSIARKFYFAEIGRKPLFDKVLREKYLSKVLPLSVPTVGQKPVRKL